MAIRSISQPRETSTRTTARTEIAITSISMAIISCRSVRRSRSVRRGASVRPELTNGSKLKGVDSSECRETGVFRFTSLYRPTARWLLPLQEMSDAGFWVTRSIRRLGNYKFKVLMRGDMKIAIAINEGVQLPEQGCGFFVRQVKVHDPEMGSLTRGGEPPRKRRNAGRC